MSYRPSQVGLPAPQHYGAPPSQYGSQAPSGYEGNFGNADQYSQEQPQDQFEQEQHHQGTFENHQHEPESQMHDHEEHHEAMNDEDHAPIRHRRGGKAEGNKRRHPLEHLHEDKNHNDMMGVMHKLSNEPITNAHLFSFIHLVMLFCAYVMKHLGATSSGEEEEDFEE